MSAPSQQSPRELDHVTRDHLPQAAWTVGGAFRFDQHLIMLMEFLNQHYPARKATRVAGAPPCVWSLDVYGRRAPMGMDFCAEALGAYAQLGLGVALMFDNPLLPEGAVDDVFGNRLVQMLFSKQYDPTGLNAVYVANDELAASIGKACPQARIFCHANRLSMAREKRTPEFYEKLEQRYRQIVLHPRDAVSPALFSRLKNPWKYSAVVNDPVPRNYAARRELLQLLSEHRRRPWDYSIVEAKESLASRTGLFSIENTGNLTCDEERALYDAGIRSFILQDFMFRNEITLWWDVFYHLLRTLPEYSNEAALIASAAMAHIRELADDIPSGMKLFKFGDL